MAGRVQAYGGVVNQPSGLAYYMIVVLETHASVDERLVAGVVMLLVDYLSRIEFVGLERAPKQTNHRGINRQRQLREPFDPALCASLPASSNRTESVNRLSFYALRHAGQIPNLAAPRPGPAVAVQASVHDQIPTVAISRFPRLVFPTLSRSEAT